MDMFVNLGRTLGLLRELRGKSQAHVAREAGIGKSQLSKYENGKELPKLDSLEKVLNALDVGHFEFFYTLYLLDDRAAELARLGDRHSQGGGDGEERERPPAPLLKAHPLLAESTDQAFTRVFSDLLYLYRRVFEQVVFAGGSAGVGGSSGSVGSGGSGVKGADDAGASG
jgi:transcriptional regulator with XRE-family HTH domain